MYKIIKLLSLLLRKEIPLKDTLSLNYFVIIFVNYFYNFLFNFKIFSLFIIYIKIKCSIY